MNIEDDILIENFLRNNLSENESVDFLARVESDIDFKEKYLFEKQLFETYNESEWNSREVNPDLVKEYKELFENSDTEKLKSTINKVQNEFEKPIKCILNKRYLYLSAAMIAIIFTIYILVPKSISSQELYATYMQKEDLPSLVIRSEEQNELIKAQEYFLNENYIDALYVFEKELKKSEIEDANIFLYTGISQIELNKFDAAEKTFDRLINSGLIDASKGKWYKALLFIKINNIKDTKEILEEIIRDKSYNYQLAVELLNKIKN